MTSFKASLRKMMEGRSGRTKAQYLAATRRARGGSAGSRPGSGSADASGSRPVRARPVRQPFRPPVTSRPLRCPFPPLDGLAMLSLDFLDDVRRMNKRQLYYQVLNFGMIVSSALMIWKGLMVITGSESPIVVVLSGSMEPAFHRGDLLFLTNRVEDPIRVGEIVVFRIEGREIPIVHRVLKIHEKQNGHIKFLTKGDNNAVDDRGLYKQGQHWLEKKDVVGRARGFVPYIGIVTILMNDYPKFKYAVLFLLGLFVLVHRE
uniref:Signal peptidase complex catalytic subunit SEC11 n=1 Tax=Felis catus TaxID=9685 RepID=A0ABI7YVE0_FELCA